MEQSGIKIIIPKMEIPNMGFSVFLDTENNMFGIYENRDTSM